MNVVRTQIYFQDSVEGLMSVVNARNTSGQIWNYYRPPAIGRAGPAGL